MKILLVEDNPKLVENIRSILVHEGYLVDVAMDGEDAFYKVSAENYDLVILDWMLPGMEGIDVCRKLRLKKNVTPILLLTAKIDLQSKVEGLDTGADDYLTKPFMMDELLARVRALLRRGSDQKNNTFLKGSITVDLSAKKVVKDGDQINLSPIEFRILEYLILNKNMTCSAMKIYEKVWGDSDRMMFSDSLKVHIVSIRKKLGKEVIRTVSGFGYMVEDAQG